MIAADQESQAFKSKMPVELRLGELPAMPASPVGAFIGVIEGNVVVIGGISDYPEQDLPANENFSQNVYVLLKDAGKWETLPFESTIAFGSAVNHEDSVVCIGGITPDGLSDKAFRIFIDKAEDDTLSLRREDLPNLPYPLALSGAAVMKGHAYVAGGATSLQPPELSKGLLSVNLPQKVVVKKKNLIDHIRAFYDSVGNLFRTVFRKEMEEARKAEAAKPTVIAWKEVDELPFENGVLRPAVGVRRDEINIDDSLYVFGGWKLAGDAEKLTVATEAARWLPETATAAGWHEVATPADTSLNLSSTVPIGPSHLLVAGLQTDAIPTLSDILRHQAGGAGMLLTYHTFTDTWVDLQKGARTLGVDVLPAGEEFVFLSRTEDGVTVDTASFEYVGSHFSALDYIVLAAYVGGLIWIGAYFSKRERGTEDFFLGGRKIPWWAAGLSIYATGVSAISFMAIPAKTYSTNWLYLGMGIFPIFSAIIAAYFFVPILRRLTITTVMEYTELRFDRTIRTIQSFLAIIGQIGGRMSITLMLPSIALSAVTGFNLFHCIIFMGVLATIYTVLGGISAVIWTDVMQVFVLFGGAILSLVVIIMNVDGGLGGTIQVCNEFGKFRAFDFTPDLTIASFWVIAIWGISDIFHKMTQEGVQRALATKDVASARRSYFTSAAVSIPGTIIFFSLGATLFAYYQGHPQELNPTLKTDGIFPLFIAQKLPAGVSGLVISGLFAASMSTLDSAMNMVSTIVTRDWFSVFNKDTSDRQQLVVARWITIVSGILATAFACFLGAQKNLGSLWDAFSIIMALIGGGFGGVGALALLTTRGHARGALIGSILNTLLLVYIKLYTDLHFFAYGTVMLVTGFIFGYVFSLILPGKKKDLTGLTVWTLAKGKNA